MSVLVVIFVAILVIGLITGIESWGRMKRRRSREEYDSKEDLLNNISLHPSLNRHHIEIKHIYYVRVPYWIYDLARREGRTVHSHSSITVHHSGDNSSQDS